MRKSKLQLAVYFVLRGAVLAVLVLELIGRRWNNVFLCVLTLVLFFVPSLIERRLKLDLPDVLETIVLLFIFAAEILGEIGEFYLRINSWDTMLHTVNGFLMAAIGFALIDVFNRSPRFHISLSPAFVAFVAFCFSMTIGVFWEFFEFTVDNTILMDMQKDDILTAISSVTLHPEGINSPVVIRDIVSTTIYSQVDGEIVETVVHGGYLDLGLRDTMEDLLVNFLGALVFSVLGALYLWRRSGFAKQFIPTLLTDEEAAREDAYLAELKARRRRKAEERKRRRQQRREKDRP